MNMTIAFIQKSITKTIGHTIALIFIGKLLQ